MVSFLLFTLTKLQMASTKQVTRLLSLNASKTHFYGVPIFKYDDPSITTGFLVVSNRLLFMSSVLSPSPPIRARQPHSLVHLQSSATRNGLKQHNLSDPRIPAKRMIVALE
ncbi:uncharacterized protein F4822DRAFT_417632 [Hypoxylon trugodes]|uniref:uncharacterized protein n=1 Tax=Hypoxylon trugodes TaxID=326681 RepID=UPI0021953171|nr:uncharacterized protein F4822DRAFT_417632 [Hypoxylon trugodes]KAI1383799.1 hypothetical protein F4822DRAFT_417632 [Hypoxylon trugodes]